MPLLAGSTTVNSGTGVATGTGLSKAIYDARAARVSFPAGALGAPGKQHLADDCNDIATAVCAHIAANLTVIVPSGIAVATTGSAAAQTGATTAPATATVS